MQLAKVNLISKVDKSHELLDDYFEMLNELSGKIDSAAQLVDENKAFLIEKLRNFQIGITKELREATEHLNLAAYEASFDKLDNDMLMLVKDFNSIRHEVSTNREDLTKWRHQVSLDMQLFYEKYDARIEEAGLPEEDRKMITESITNLNSNILLNKQNIKSLAGAIDRIEASTVDIESKRQRNYDLLTKLTQQHDNQLSKIDAQIRQLLPEFNLMIEKHIQDNDASKMIQIIQDAGQKMTAQLEE